MYQETEVYSEGSRQVPAGEMTVQVSQELCTSDENLKNGAHLSPTAADESYCFIASDSTAVLEFSFTGNTRFSEQIIHGVRATCDLEKLKGLKGKKQEYLNEGREQINALWHGIHALNIHTEMFTVFFLIAMGSILNEIKESFERPHEFARWRDSTFGSRHKRLFQEAEQLAGMGDFSRKYAAMGKTRILQIEAIRDAESKASCEDILRESTVYNAIAESALPDEVVTRLNEEPFPDISYDSDCQRVKNYVSSIITQRRLINAGITYVDFDQAQLIAEYCGEAIQVNEVKRIKAKLDKIDEAERPAFFNNLVMDRMKNTPANVRDSKSVYSLNKVIADFVRYCKNINFDDTAWLAKQQELIDRNSVFLALNYLNQVIVKLELNAGEKASSISIQGGLKQ
jgi:hypothetical protein